MTAPGQDQRIGPEPAPEPGPQPPVAWPVVWLGVVGVTVVTFAAGTARFDAAYALWPVKVLAMAVSGLVVGALTVGFGGLAWEALRSLLRPAVGLDVFDRIELDNVTVRSAAVTYEEAGTERWPLARVELITGGRSRLAGMIDNTRHVIPVQPGVVVTVAMFTGDYVHGDVLVGGWEPPDTAWAEALAVDSVADDAAGGVAAVSTQRLVDRLSVPGRAVELVLQPTGAGPLEGHVTDEPALCTVSGASKAVLESVIGLSERRRDEVRVLLTPA
jgi:hypothetical protein